MQPSHQHGDSGDQEPDTKPSYSNTTFSRYLKYIRPSGGIQQVTAIGLHKGRLVSVGNNQYKKTHPKQKDYAKRAKQTYREYLHAEIDCIVKANSHIDTLIVFRVGRNGKLSNAKPCPICQLAIKQAKVKTVIHS